MNNKTVSSATQGGTLLVLFFSGLLAPWQGGSLLVDEILDIDVIQLIIRIHIITVALKLKRLDLFSS